MKRVLRSVFIVGVLSFAVLGFMVTPAISGGPTDGFDIHVQAPHMMADGTVGGPYHHYCKGNSSFLRFLDQVFGRNRIYCPKYNPCSTGT